MDTGSAERFIVRSPRTPPEEWIMDGVTGIAEYLLANPMYLIPILFMVAMMVYAILKKLLKIAAIVAITGGLYVALVEYFGSGF